jgi:multidrug efflux pump subunit AcrA (membrane-fusion protein)
MNTTTQLITITGAESTQVSALPAAIAKRDELLAIAAKGKRIASPESCQRATGLLRDLKMFEKAINDAHATAKAPVLELGRKIDALKKDLLNEVTTEAARIGRLIGDYETEQAKIRREEEARAAAEAKRLREEAEAKERAAREEAARKEAAARAAAEKAAAEGDVLAKAQAERAAADARAKAEQEAAVAKAQAEAQIAAQRAAVVAQAPKPAGVSTREDVDFEVTDMAALYAANPSLVTLTVKRTELKAALKALPEGATLPGVRHWKTSQAVVRSA